MPTHVFPDNCVHDNAVASSYAVNTNLIPLALGKTRQEAAIAATLSRITHVLFVMSGKGGVGKSMVTVNLAAALANRGCKVGILDVDLHGPSVPVLLGLKEKLHTNDGVALHPIQRGDNLRVLSIHSLLPENDTAVIWRGPKKTAAIRQFLSDVLWGDLDYLLIDSPPGTGDEHLAVLQAIPSAQCLVVTTSQEISLADVRKALRFLKKTKANLLGLVENMSTFPCPHCAGRINLFAEGGGKALARKQNIPFLGKIPFDTQMTAAVESGKPIVEFAGPSVAKGAFLMLADQVAAHLR